MFNNQAKIWIVKKSPISDAQDLSESIKKKLPRLERALMKII